MRIIAITQARVGSTRLPGKILKKVGDKTLLQIHLERILKSKLITKLKVATTNEDGVGAIVSIANSIGVSSYKGSLLNVLERFYLATKDENPDWVVRLTSDCPLIDASVIDDIISYAIKNDFDYVSNTLNPTFPDGLDVEVFKYSALEKAYEEAVLESDLEHVTPYIWRNSTYKGGHMFKSDGIENLVNLSNIRLTVDTIEDFIVIKKILEAKGDKLPWKKYVSFLEDNDEVAEINSHHKRNEGYQKSIDND